MNGCVPFNTFIDRNTDGFAIKIPRQLREWIHQSKEREKKIKFYFEKISLTVPHIDVEALIESGYKSHVDKIRRKYKIRNNDYSGMYVALEKEQIENTLKINIAFKDDALASVSVFDCRYALASKNLREIISRFNIESWESQKKTFYPPCLIDWTYKNIYNNIEPIEVGKVYNASEVFECQRYYDAMIRLSRDNIYTDGSVIDPVFPIDKLNYLPKFNPYPLPDKLEDVELRLWVLPGFKTTITHFDKFMKTFGFISDLYKLLPPEGGDDIRSMSNNTKLIIIVRNDIISKTAVHVDSFNENDWFSLKSHRIDGRDCSEEGVILLRPRDMTSAISLRGKINEALVDLSLRMNMRLQLEYNDGGFKIVSSMAKSMLKKYDIYLNRGLASLLNLNKKYKDIFYEKKRHYYFLMSEHDIVYVKSSDERSSYLSLNNYSTDHEGKIACPLVIREEYRKTYFSKDASTDDPKYVLSADKFRTFDNSELSFTLEYPDYNQKWNSFSLPFDTRVSGILRVEHL